MNDLGDLSMVRRKLLMNTGRKFAPVLESDLIHYETKRKMIKWYLGTFPVPRVGVAIPKREAAELR